MPIATFPPDDPNDDRELIIRLLAILGPRINANGLMFALICRLVDANGFIHTLLHRFADAVFRDSFLLRMARYIKEHPYQAAFMVAGIVLSANPLALAGFGTLGPIAGSIAAGWQASMGASVVAGSLFSVLQSAGMVYGAVMPAIGGGILGSAVVSAVVEAQIERIKEWGRALRGWWNGLTGW
ncbi:hypothetical protein BJ508DRAFT_313134 [Ascobolus immersus RN42]|uniref:Uncharacterized protein n=1 Tax=Ascobolus immersus RN42 TaxID=1160509 RepID=A0A3N4HQ41_ASCIM|nr:hypothetical protein BJ508DRAFT_313134 [Ascobolus immersus RN42]